MPEYIEMPVQKHWCIDLYMVDLEDPLYIRYGLPEGWEFVLSDTHSYSGWSGGCGYIRYPEVKRVEN